MALGFDHGPRFVAGDKRMHFAEISFESNYTAGGEFVSASDFGLKHMEVLFLGQSNRGRHVYWNQTAGTLQVFNSSGSEHVGALGTGANTQKCHAVAVGV